MKNCYNETCRTTAGYWEPHSSSVDFCEKNYLWSTYIVEPHNVWSSAMISVMALIGLLYGNPTGEYRFRLMFGVLFIVGIGSCGLHSTLHWILQSSDEVPMLWQNWTFLYAMAEIKSPKFHCYFKYLHLLVLAIVIAQTIIYYKFQQYFVVFLASYVSLVSIIIVWTIQLVFDSRHPSTFRYRLLLWSIALFTYVGVGSSVWIIDMNFCDELSVIYKYLGGMTFHVLWHLAAGYGTYVTAVLLTLIRCEYLEYEFDLHWIGGVLPICRRLDAARQDIKKTE